MKIEKRKRTRYLFTCKQSNTCFCLPCVQRSAVCVCFENLLYHVIVLLFFSSSIILSLLLYLCNASMLVTLTNVILRIQFLKYV